MKKQSSSYPYAEATAEFMDMAGHHRPGKLIIPLPPEGGRQPPPGDTGTLKGLQESITQVVARIRHPVLRLRLALLMEEVYELAEAGMREDMAGIARNVADVLYVAHSIPLSLGYDGEAVYDCVHKANMTKRMGKTRSDGKQLPPVDFRPPDVEAVLAASQREETSETADDSTCR
ncbi:MAG: MazG nucleotide pyrophosphohydrolase domain-containing protein [Verrucomicrobiae bacterium]|nr:MazG nucleotide pyrophosphohydrolase domain-containing protein [Verrucomicrobiae bacterium]